jgi:hypothetical protein
MTDILKFISFLFLGVATLAIFVFFMEWGVERYETYECQKWVTESKQYENYYMTKWQAEQCKARNVDIGNVSIQ